MNKTETLFLEALRASLLDTCVDWSDDKTLTPDDWTALFSMADAHHVLPMIYEAVYKCPAAECAAPVLMTSYRQRMTGIVVMQSMRTEEFLRLFTHLENQGIHPLVVKGLVLRNMYPRPDFRISGDEDVWILSGEFARCHEAMLGFGMEPVDPGQDMEEAHEISYVQKNGPLRIEMHKSLFPPESRAYGDLNRFFENARARVIRVPARSATNVECVSAAGEMASDTIATLAFSDHLLYLICHALKHFLHSGFGIRQVCDIFLFANLYGKGIDWEDLLRKCREIRADRFAAAIFKIGEKYLTFDPEAAGYPAAWREIRVDETMMLRDLLEAGVFGNSSMSRRHSSTMTLEAVAARKAGNRDSHGLAGALFPPARDLEGRYGYLRNKPFLLPLAWVQRIAAYAKESKGKPGDSAREAVEIGKQRIRLLEEYGIIDR